MERAEKKNDRFEHKTEQDPTIVYGKNAVTELLKSGAAVDTVFVQDTMNAAQAGYYTAIAREAGAVVKRVHAAKLRGMTLTGYLIATAGEDARRTVEDADVLRLAAEDQVRFANALIDPPAPNARLARAAKRHADLIAPR